MKNFCAPFGLWTPALPPAYSRRGAYADVRQYERAGAHKVAQIPRLARDKHIQNHAAKEDCRAVERNALSSENAASDPDAARAALDSQAG